MPWLHRAFPFFLAATFVLAVAPWGASRAEELPATLELTDVDGTNGVVLRSVVNLAEVGEGVAPAGDVNGDGIDDIVIGAPTNNGSEYVSRPGVAYIVFGLPEPPPDLNLSALDGTDGFALFGTEDYDLAGRSVAPAGDFNGDGLGDVVIGAVRAGPDLVQQGEAYVVFGSVAGFPPALSLASLDGTNGFTMRGGSYGDHLGTFVAGGGDLNGDGFGDVAIGAGGADANGRGSGEVYVLFGTDEAVPSLLRPDALDGSNGFIIRGIRRDDWTSITAFAGDFDGDGFDDLLVGGVGADPHGPESGQAYLVYGSGAPFPPILELSALHGSNGFALRGIHAGDKAGSVGPAGDFNGDGFADIAIGAGRADPNGDYSGQSYVVFGTDALFPRAFELSALNGSNGFALNGIAPGDLAGSSIATAGDVNRDGFDDLLVGAPWADPNGTSSGQAYVVFGTDAPMSSAFELSALDDSNGVTINGGWRYHAGDSVAAAGDFNSDGVADWIVGAPSMGSSRGAAYVLFGRPAVLSVAIDVRPSNPHNVINPFGRGVVAVALLGSAVFDVSEVEIGSLAFGPAGAPASERPRPQLRDVNGDGVGDLVARFPVDETGIAVGDTEACLTGETLDGTPIEGCDAISTVPSCGTGFELALVVPPLLWWRRLRLHAQGAPPAG